MKIDEIDDVQIVKAAHVSVTDWLFSDGILSVPEGLDRVERYQIKSHYIAALTCLAYTSTRSPPGRSTARQSRW